MMNCKRKLKNLGDLIDGKASLMRKMTFYMHILMCPKCKQYYKQFKMMHEAASEVEPSDLPDDFFMIMDDALLGLNPPSDSSSSQQEVSKT